VFKGVTIAGEPVGGMTKAGALKVAEAKVKPLSEALKLYYADQEFELDPKSYSVRPQPQSMAYAAFLKGREDLLPVRLFKRLFGISNKVDIPVLYSYDRAKLEKLVQSVAETLNKDPTSVHISVATGRPDIIPSENGVKVKVDKTLSDVTAKLPDAERRVPVVVEYIHPEQTEKDIGRIIVIKLSEFRLYLYEREKYVDDYLVAVGMKEYPTPTGKFHVTYKEKNPTWLPTSEWAKDKQGVPQPPGKDNPLGDYWIDIGGGIGIHGTPYVKSLGEQASHGCIRMRNEDAKVLYETVNVGAPVFIIE
jgi:lipoprotein-anchoring transpeptidase ErfK/SrfK